MKTLHLFLLLFILSSAQAQEDPVTHCIFFLKHKDTHLREVKEGDRCIIGIVQRTRRYEGEIKKISLDSVFIADTVIRIRDVTYFSFRDELKSPILLTKPSDLPREYFMYGKDTLIWKAKVPPPYIFTSGSDYHKYIRYQEDSLKYGGSRRPAPPKRGPFMNMPRPGHK